VHLEVELALTQMADMAELVPGSVRTGARTVSFRHDDYREVFRAVAGDSTIWPAWSRRGQSEVEFTTRLMMNTFPVLHVPGWSEAVAEQGWPGCLRGGAHRAAAGSS
jgi:hypothetical protein